MSLTKSLSAAALLLALAGGVAAHYANAATAAQTPGAGPVYELRTYTAAPGKFDALNSRFRDHTVRLFARHGVKNITYWTPTDGPLAGNTLIYVIPHASREAAATFWKNFQSDPEWVKARAASVADGPLTTSVTSVFLTTTDYSGK